MADVPACVVSHLTESRTSEAQDSWIPNGTIRSNILMSGAYDAVRYAKVVQACALDVDVAAMPQGDNAEVGEKGATLSGAL